MNIQADLDAAVEADILSEEQGTRLYEFLRQRKLQGDEDARPIPSFNEAFVSIAPALLLLAGGALAARFSR